MPTTRLSKYFNESIETRSARRANPRVDLSSGGINEDTPQLRVGPFDLCHRTLAEVWRHAFYQYEWNRRHRHASIRH